MLERRIRRLAVVSVISTPVLLMIGLGLGLITSQSLTLPEHAPVRLHPSVVVSPAELDTLVQAIRKVRNAGEWTEEYVTVYREHVAPVEMALRRRGVDPVTSRKVAWPLVEHAAIQGLDPALVVSVVLVESSGKPTARSPVGARGLMQVMPFWAGHWSECGTDLYDIAGNLCYGTRILSEYLARFRGDERRALLGYNGCVRGTNTPNCHTYPDKVQSLRRQIQAEWDRRPVETIRLAVSE